MAKGVEDCAFYRSSRLTSLNEVGADPSIFAVTPEEWHEAMVIRQRDWPNAMTTLTTHDTKRGEDVRARLAVLAEIPGAWEQALDRLLSMAPLPIPASDPCCGRRFSVSGRPKGTCPTTCASGCTGTPRRRCARPATTPRGPIPTRTTRPLCTPRSTQPSTTPMSASVLDDLVEQIAAAGSEQQPRDEAGVDHDAGCAGRLPGQRGRAVQPGRPRQPAAGGLRRRCGQPCRRVQDQAGDHRGGTPAAPRPA